LSLPLSALIETEYEAGDTLKIVGDIPMVAADWTKLRALKTKEYALVVNDATTSGPMVNGLAQSKITSFTAENLTSVTMMMFGSCTSLTDVELPNAARIAGMAFAVCSSLKNIYAPNVTDVGIGAFGNCTSLTDISLPAAKNIKGAAFSACTSLTGVSLPAAEDIGEGTFSGCSSLENITLPSAKTIGRLAFGKIDTKDDHSGEVISSQYCSSLVTVSLPAAESIGEEAFSYCESLAAVSMPSVTSIGNKAFINSTSLTTLVLPDTAPNAADDAFSGIDTSKINIYVPGTPSGYDSGSWAGIAPPTVPALSIETSSLPAGTIGVLYEQTLKTDSAFPIVWSIESGSLPDGLNLDAAVGKIAGVPAKNGTFGFMLKASNASNSTTATKELSITIKENSVEEDVPAIIKPKPDDPQPELKPDTPDLTVIGDGDDSERTTAIVVPIDPDNVRIDEGGAAAVVVPKGTLSQSAIDRAIEAAGETDTEPTLMIQIKQPTADGTIENAREIREVNVEIQISDLILVADNEASIKITSPAGEVKLNADALTDLIAGAEDRNAAAVEIIVAKCDEAELENLTEAQNETLGSDEIIRAVFDLSVRVGDQRINDFRTTGILTIGLPYVLASGEDPDGIKVDYVKEDGELERIPGSRYNESKQLAVFQVNHLSIFAVVYDKKSEQESELSGKDERGQSGGGCDTGVGFAGLAIFALGSAVATKRGKPRN
jgi:hypothetical protein